MIGLVDVLCVCMLRYWMGQRVRNGVLALKVHPVVRILHRVSRRVMVHECDGERLNGPRRLCARCRARWVRERRLREPDRWYEQRRGQPIWRAKVIVMNAIGSGKLARAKTRECVDCGSQASVYYHADYLKPLDIVPVCWGCFYRRPKGANSTER